MRVWRELETGARCRQQLLRRSGELVDARQSLERAWRPWIERDRATQLCFRTCPVHSRVEGPAERHVWFGERIVERNGLPRDFFDARIRLARFARVLDVGAAECERECRPCRREIRI